MCVYVYWFMHVHIWQAIDCVVACFSNRAVCRTKRGKPLFAAEDASQVHTYTKGSFTLLRSSGCYEAGSIYLYVYVYIYIYPHIYVYRYTFICTYLNIYVYVNINLVWIFPCMSGLSLRTLRAYIPGPADTEVCPSYNKTIRDVFQEKRHIYSKRDL